MIKRIVVKGAVQGIGYRPFVYEKATEYGLSGYVKNCGASVEILASGADEAVKAFIDMLSREVPAGGFVLAVESIDENMPDLALISGDFKIIDSSALDLSSELPIFLPDIGICDDCMAEMLNPANRRYRYPLISCAVCGPRMSILNRLPYDRNTTTMEDFEMCPSCQKDYGTGRRKYAQTISCHDCGPQMMLKINESHSEVAGVLADSESYIGEEAVQKALHILRNDGIIGLKGISGYQLVCRPEGEMASRLRRVKGRENKPFAIMFSTVEQVKEYAFVSEKEEELLTSSARPIVLVERKENKLEPQDNTNSDNHYFPEEVLKGSRYIGAFLPSAGIHRLITDELGPLIVTSANKSDQPMIIDDEKFLSIFMPESSDEENAFVDAVLYHKRRINMAQDDSVMFVISINGEETEQFIRRARGFAPLPVLLNKKQSEASVLAVGGDLKSCFAFGKGDRIIPSQYIGDLEDLTTYNSYNSLLSDYQRIFEFKADIVVKDLHPDYFSSKIAKKVCEDTVINCEELQHHFAHIYSVMAENGLKSAIGAAFDGTGYGLDGKIWGSEFVYCNGASPKRLGHLSYIKLAGGNEAPKNAKNVTLCYIHECEKRGLLNAGSYEVLSDNGLEYRKGKDLSQSEKLIFAALDNNVNTFETSSMGRLFDAVSALLGICSYNSYEGEAAIMLEKAALEFSGSADTHEKLDYPHFEFLYYKDDNNECFIADQAALFADIYNCYREGAFTAGAIAYGFHMAVRDLIVKGCRNMAQRNADPSDISDAIDSYTEKNICLSGGVFNNRLLLEGAVKALLPEGFDVYWNRKVPLGDGGISTGQAYYGLLCGR